jgi:uncharacterized membrane protein YedE/YeeE
MFELLRGPWPWYVVGPLIGAMVPLLLVGGNRQFGVSNSLRTLCAATIPAGIEYFKYDWKRHGAWNLAFVAGILTGGLISGFAIGVPRPELAEPTRAALAAMGITGISGLVPAALISWEALTTWKGALLIAGGGFAIGFGTAWGGGCSSGHAISGLADLQPASAIAVVSFFAGGLLATWVILPRLFA